MYKIELIEEIICRQQPVIMVIEQHNLCSSLNKHLIG